MSEKTDAAADDAVDADAAAPVVAALDVDAVVVVVVTFAVRCMPATIVQLTVCDCDCNCDAIGAKVIEKIRWSHHDSRTRTTVCFRFLIFTRFGRGSCSFG